MDTTHRCPMCDSILDPSDNGVCSSCAPPPVPEAPPGSTEAVPSDPEEPPPVPKTQQVVQDGGVVKNQGSSLLHMLRTVSDLGRLGVAFSGCAFLGIILNIAFIWLAVLARPVYVTLNAESNPT